LTTREPTDHRGITWRKSNRSNAGNDCVEIARTRAGIAIRDSKNPHQPHLTLSTEAFANLLADIKQGTSHVPQRR
jgi:Domain of unknown function (DUF397)